MLNFDQMTRNLGNSYLKIYNDFMPLSREAMYERQQRNYRRMKRELLETRIGKDLRLEFIRNYDEYVRYVPVWSYENYAHYVDMAVAGNTNVLFRDEISYFGLSSGTSGKNSKRIPYNERMIKMFVKSQKRVASRLSRLEGDINLLNVGRLTFGSDPYLYSENGFKFGYISGILSTRVPKALAKNTFPSREVLAISDWDKKIDTLISEAMVKDIQVASGIPTYLISIFEAVLAKTGCRTINEIWPNLRLMVYAATPIKQYQERIDRLVGHKLTYYGLYASTEAAIGLPYEAFDGKRQRYFLNPDLLYSFTAVDDPRLNHGIDQVELGRHYYLNVGTPNGFIHYAMKDVVSFEVVNGDLVFEFVGRKATGMNLAAEKVSDEQILDAVLLAKQRSNLDIRHFFLSPLTENGKTLYHWTLFVPEGVQPNKEELAKILDQAMCELNHDYQDCREVNVLAQAQVHLMNAETLQSYFEAHRDKGQFKMKTTFETAEEYVQFMRQHFEEKRGVQ